MRFFQIFIFFFILIQSFESLSNDCKEVFNSSNQSNNKVKAIQTSFSKALKEINNAPVDLLKAEEELKTNKEKLETEDPKSISNYEQFYLKTLVLSLITEHLHSLRFPTEIEFFETNQIENKKDFFKLLGFLGIKNYHSFLKEITSNLPVFKKYQTDKMVSAYINAIKKPKKENQMYASPSKQDLLKSAKEEFSSEVTQRSLDAFLNINLKGSSSKADIFIESSWLGLKELAKQKQPNLFKNFADNHLLNELSHKSLQAVKNHDGFIVSSVTSGVPLNDSYFNLLLRTAKKEGVPLILIPVNKDIENLPRLQKTKGNFYSSTIEKPEDEDGNLITEGFLNLHDIDNVHVLTHSMEVTEFLKLSAISLMARNLNPFASLNRLTDKNRITVVAHPQYRVQVESTDSNDVHPTIFLSTGSISTMYYPSNTRPTERLSELAKEKHDNSALFFRKTNKGASLMNLDTPGLYHFAALELQKHLVSGNEKTGLILDGVFHPEETGEKSKKLDLDYLILGDLHIGETNQKIYTTLQQTIKKYQNVNHLLLHDFFNGESINHHEKGNILAQSQLHEERMTLYQEFRNSVQVLNALLEANPNMKIVLVHSNHPEWLSKYIADAKAYADSPNSKFITEIRAGMDQYNESPFGYLYKYREKHLLSNPKLVSRRSSEEHEIFISDPDRIDVLDKGDKLYAGISRHDTIILYGHGHNAQGGRGGISPSLAHNLPPMVIGHTHSPRKEGDLINVGTSTKQNLPYTRDNTVSNWVNGSAHVYKDTSKPILFISLPTVADADYDPSRGVLSGEAFFGEGYPHIIPNSNEILGDESFISGNTEGGEKNKRKRKSKKN